MEMLAPEVYSSSIFMRCLWGVCTMKFSLTPNEYVKYLENPTLLVEPQLSRTGYSILRGSVFTEHQLGVGYSLVLDASDVPCITHTQTYQRTHISTT